MCEVPRMRERRIGPLTPAMRALLERMQATTSPALTDWGRRPYPTTLDGEMVNGATLNGLEIRGLVEFTGRSRNVASYVLTDAGREAVTR